MPRWQSVLDAKLNEYEAQLRAKRRRHETILEYRRVIERAFRGLAEAGLKCFPRSVGEEEVAYLYAELYAGLEPLVARSQLSIVGRFLARTAANNVVERMDLEWPESERLNVRWLDPEKCIRLLRCAQGPARIVVSSKRMISPTSRSGGHYEPLLCEWKQRRERRRVILLFIK